MIRTIKALQAPEYLECIQIISVVISTLSLIIASYLGHQQIKQQKIENDRTFELDYADFLYSVNYVFELINTMESECDAIHFPLSREKINQIENNMIRLSIEIAHIIGRKTDGFGKIKFDLPREDQYLRIPLKYVKPSNNLAMTVSENCSKLSDYTEEELVKANEDIINMVKSSYHGLEKHIHL
ncbi:hypothetical protein HMPREF2758_06825 [Facklamia sp. HMSC062C11]|uniref:hypothetical protein n=1 Tax=Facklamia sp. HMSC062C11 TaxID=1739262 RepID=UPI0008A57407|nr:hypothetical protein [Facklamia sp. HMSC062C11]OFL66850.1 hypothetical protein HMPREF2758_06825 [Facklamia sp. HMSC062C11]